MANRRARRRQHASRADRSAPRRRYSLTQRIVILAVSLMAIVAGGLLLVAGGTGNQARLARVAGILIVLGCVGLFIGVVGSL